MKYYYDLHIHSALSPCGSDDMTPNNIANMSKIKGLDIIAVTDHNSALNVASVMACAKPLGLSVVAGMEIETQEAVHLISLFPSLEHCMNMHEIITNSLDFIPNKEDIFGKQLVMDSEDNIVGQIDNMLINSTRLSVDEVIKSVNELNGVVIPAHIDKQSYSVISNLGFIPSEWGLKTVEMANLSKLGELKQWHKYLDDYTIIHSSDAHYLENISEQEFYLELEENSASCLIERLKTTIKTK